MTRSSYSGPKNALLTRFIRKILTEFVFVIKCSLICSERSMQQSEGFMIKVAKCRIN